MPISPQQARHSARSFEIRKENHYSNKTIQHEMEALANKQQTKLPRKTDLLFFLALASAASSLRWGEDSPKQLPRHTRQGNHGNAKPPADNASLISSLETISYNSNITTAQRLPSTPCADLLSDSPLRNQSPSPSTFRLSALRSLFQTASEVSSFIHKHDPLRFPSAEANVPPIASQNEAAPEVIAEKIDFSCIEEREDLSLADVLIKIADTLEKPLTEMSKESQVLLYYAEGSACPTKEEIEKVTNITLAADDIASQIDGMIPQFKSLTFIKNIFAPVLRMLAHCMLQRKINTVDVVHISEEIIFFTKAMIEISSITNEGHESTAENNMSSIPDDVFFQDENVFIKVEKESWQLTRRYEQFFATKDAVSRKVHYNADRKRWEFTNERIENIEQTEVMEYLGTNREDPFFNTCHYRTKRGNRQGTLCSVAVVGMEEARDRAPSPELIEPQDVVIRFVQPSPLFSPAQQVLIDSLDTGLKESSSRVKKFHFEDGWEIFRVQTKDKLASKIYHAININGKLVPARTHKIFHQFVSCEIYDLDNSRFGFPVAFQNGQWQFESPTSAHVSESLLKYTPPEAFEKKIYIRQLSTPGVRGLKMDASGHAYLPIKGHFVKIIKAETEPVIRASNGDNYYLTYAEDQFHLAHAQLKNSRLAVSVEQLKNDIAMHSPRGLDILHSTPLNEAWNLLDVNIKNNNHFNAQSIGSKIDVTFKLHYKGHIYNQFQELPPLQWHERIKLEQGEQTWQFISDMFEHNKKSLTFFPWHYRYLEAYHFTKAHDKRTFNGNVRLYDESMRPLDPDTLPEASSPKTKAEYVKNHLEKKGGLLEITITDLPQLGLDGAAVSKERVVHFDIGFNDESFAKFSQGISIVEGIPDDVFVSTSSNIQLAIGEINALAPDHVSRKRVLKHRH